MNNLRRVYESVYRESNDYRIGKTELAPDSGFEVSVTISDGEVGISYTDNTKKRNNYFNSGESKIPLESTEDLSFYGLLRAINTTESEKWDAGETIGKLLDVTLPAIKKFGAVQFNLYFKNALKRAINNAE